MNRVCSGFVSFLAAAVGALAQAPASDATPLAKLLDRWVDERFVADAGHLRVEIAAAVAAAKLDLHGVEQIVRAPRASYPQPLAAPGKVAQLPLRCDHVDYDTSFFLYIPKSYDQARAWPLALIGHGGNSEMTQQRAEATARSYLAAFVAAAEAKGFVIAAPATARGWGPIGNSILLSLISKLQRDLHLDADRIYVTGHSMGGHLSWRSGIYLADRWGAVAPMSGGYDYVANELVVPLFNVPGYATHGKDEPYQIADFNRKIRGWMEQQRYPWRIVEKSGGHEIFADEVPKVFEFFAAHPRNLYPERIAILTAGPYETRGEAKKPRWDKEHTWHAQRPVMSETTHWARVFALPAGTPAERHLQRALIERRGRSEVVVTSKHVPRLRLYLHPSQFDLEAPLTVMVNGKAREVTPVCGLDVMLDLVREFDDRARVFHGYVDVAIDSDLEVPLPRGE